MCITQISPFCYLNRPYRTVKAGHNVYYNILFQLTVNDIVLGHKLNEKLPTEAIADTTHVDVDTMLLPYSAFVLI